MDHDTPAPNPGFEVVRLGGNIGAEIRGLDLGRPLDDATFQALEAAFVRHEVLVFRDQDISTDEHQIQGAVISVAGSRMSFTVMQLLSEPALMFLFPRSMLGSRLRRGS